MSDTPPQLSIIIITPIPTDRAFYPLPNDIKNHVGNAKRALELSKLDQENLRLKIEAWQKDSPESTHYFRPYVKKSQEQSPPLPQTSVQNSEHAPGMFLGDYSEAEQLAIMEVFPECTVYSCDFHREQAWERWVRDHHHKLSKDEGDELLHLLRECAHAPAMRPQENLPHDHYYNLALNSLKSSSIWLHN